MEHVAVGWLVFDITGSAFIVGVAAAARMAPLFFLGILSGAMADWLERRLFLLFIALSGMAVAGIMAVVLLTGTPDLGGSCAGRSRWLHARLHTNHPERLYLRHRGP